MLDPYAYGVLTKEHHERLVAIWTALPPTPASRRIGCTCEYLR